MPATLTVKHLTHEWTAKSDRGRTTGQTTHHVYASEPTTPAYILQNAPTGVPVEGGNYPDVTGLPCVSRDCKAVDANRKLFVVTCEYDSTVSSFPASPLSAPTKFSYASESAEETYYEDKTPEGDGGPKRARHTNGLPFTELPKRDDDILVIEIEKNVASSTTLASVWVYLKKVSDGPVTLDGNSFSAGQLRVTSVSLSDVKTENGVSYKTRRITVKARPDGWDQKYESMGLFEFDEDWGEVKPITVSGVPITEPWPLDDSGAKRADRREKGFEIVLKPYGATSLSGIG